MSTKEFVSLEELWVEIQPEIEEAKRLHSEDGLFDARDIKIYVDMFRKSIVRHSGSDFVIGRTSINNIASKASQKYGKTLEITRADVHSIYPVVHLKEKR